MWPGPVAGRRTTSAGEPSDFGRPGPRPVRRGGGATDGKGDQPILWGVEAIAADDVLAVGTVNDFVQGGGDSMIQHLDGHDLADRRKPLSRRHPLLIGRTC